jgi:adenylate cyclase
LSQVYLWKKQHDQAIVAGERVIALDPNFADGYAGLGIILIAVGRPEKGIGLIEKAIRLNPRSPAWYLMNLGFAYCQVGRNEEALSSLKKALTLNPNIVHARIALAACYAELGRLEEARAEVAETLRLQPDFYLEVTRQVFPSKDPADLERLLAALRKVGLK